MTDPFDRGGPIRLSWQDRFRDKWPYMTTLMYDNGGQGMDTINGGRPNGNSVSMDNLHRGPAWSQPQQDMWTERRSLDHDKGGSELSSNASKSQKSCGRACNIALCAFLFITIVTALCAGVGLAILLNGENETEKLSGSQEDIHLDGFLAPDEEIYLTKQFCNLVKVIMRSTNYPLKEGIDHCYAILRLIKGSEELQIEMRVQPTARYTMKEKFRRALREQTLAEATYRINRTNTCVKTTPRFPVQKCSKGRMLAERPRIIVPTFDDSNTTYTTQNITTPSENLVTEYTKKNRTVFKANHEAGVFVPSTTLDIWPSVSNNAVNDVSVTITPAVKNSLEKSIEPTSTFRIHSLTDEPTQPISSSSHNVASEFTSSSYLETSSSIPTSTASPLINSLNYQNIVNVGDSISMSTSSTVTPPTTTLLPSYSETLSTSSDVVSYSTINLVSSSEVSSTDMYSSRIPLQTSEVMSSSSTDIISIPSTSILSSLPVRLQSSNTDDLGTASTTKISPSSSTTADSTPTSYIPPTPFQTVAKTKFKVNSNLIHKPEPEITTQGAEKKTIVNKSRVVENLMLGGVLKLPFKTTSQFRFLFADNSDRRAASPVLSTIAGAEKHLKGPVTTTNSFSIVSNKEKAKIRFDNGGAATRNEDTSRKITINQPVITSRPIPPPIFTGNSRNAQNSGQQYIGNNMNSLRNRNSF